MSIKIARSFALASLVFTACQDDPPNTPISQFDRPQDVALVCYDGTQIRDLDACCKEAGCGGIPGAHLIGFVTQTTPGEVAVVDLGGQQVLDQDVRVPYNSFIPVGGQPSDIAARHDGKLVFTVNTETEDISVIDTKRVFQGEISPARAIDLGGPGARLAMLKMPADEDYRDRYAFITQPTLDRIAVVQLETPQNATSGKLLGYVELSAAADPEETDSASDEPADTSGEGAPNAGRVFPWAIQSSSRSPLVYVASPKSHFVLELNAKLLVDEARGLKKPGPLSLDKALVRKLGIKNFTIRDFDIEPEVERWIYAVENERGGVIVIDLVTGELVPANQYLRFRSDPYSIEVPGRARAVSIVRVSEDGARGPLTFNGTFAVVATTMAGIFVIEVEDEDLKGAARTRARHRMRSSVDLSKAENRPALSGPPVMSVDNSTVPADKASQYAYLEVDSDSETDSDSNGDSDTQTDGETDSAADTDSDTETSGDGDSDSATQSDDRWKGFQARADPNGFRFRKDPRESSAESWNLVWQGKIGVSGAAVVDFAASALKKGQLVVRDESTDFCAAGLKMPKRCAGADTDCQGDLFVITSEPTPLENYAGKCANHYEAGKLIYQVKELIDANTLRLGSVHGEPASWLPTVECYGQAFNYELRAYRHWTLAGSASGHLRDSKLGKDSSGKPICVEGTRTLEGKTQRVYDGEPFANYTLAFTLHNGEKLEKSDEDDEEDTEPEPEDVSIAFSVEGGFQMMSRALGSDITDVVFGPTREFIIIDRAGQGLILFDLLDNFSVIGSPIN